MATTSGGSGFNNPPLNREDCLTKAAEAASRVNALLIAKGKLKPSEIGKLPKKVGKKKFDAEVEINDAPIICRDILTKNATQEEIARKTGAVITTKGRFMTGEQRHLADSIQDRPLYLYIQAETEENVQKAVGEINTIISSHGGMVNQTRGSTISIEAPSDYQLTTTDNRQIAAPPQSTQSLPPRPDLSQPPPGYIPASNPVSLAAPHTQVSFLTEKLYIGLEHAPPTFDVRAKMLGADGSYLQHIHASSGAVVTLRGRNSGYLENETALESTEPMHVHLQHITPDGLEQARSLANDLIKTVQNEYSQFQRHLALQGSSSVVSHALPTGHSLPGHALVTMQNIVPGLINYQGQEQQVILSSATSVPMSIVLSHQSPYSHTKTPMYVQSGVQPVPVTVPVNTELMAHTPVGYNSLTSQGVEIVHQAVPLARPLPSIQPLTSEVVASGAQSLMTVRPVLEPANQPSVHGPPNGPCNEMPHAQSQAVAVPVSIQVAPTFGAPAESSHSCLPVTVSVVPIICTAAQPTFTTPPYMTTSGEGVILVSQPVTSVTDSVNHRTARTIYHQIPVSSNHPHTSVIAAKPPVEAVTYILQRPVVAHPPPPAQPPSAIEAHLVHVESVAQSHPENASHMQPSSAQGHMTAVLADNPNAQTLTLNEYGQLPMVQAPVSVVHVQQHPEMISHHAPAAALVNHTIDGGVMQVSAAHMERLPSSETMRSAALAAGHHGVPRYPPPSIAQTPAPIIPPLTSGQVVVPSLMDLEIQVRHPPPPPPTIEPPPHLADSSYHMSKRQYRDKPYCQIRNEIRPPYRGAGRPYSTISPPPPSSRNSFHDTGARYKRQYHPNYSSLPP